MASKASLTYSAIRARLPELPTEFYDYEILHKIGEKLGQLIRTNSCTPSALRGKYARLCVVVPIEKLIKTHIVIGKHLQQITYEGFNVLCTNCRRLGHIHKNCPSNKTSCNTSSQEDTSTSNGINSIISKVDQWAIVSHQRKQKKTGGATGKEGKGVQTGKDILSKSPASNPTPRTKAEESQTQHNSQRLIQAKERVFIQ